MFFYFPRRTSIGAICLLQSLPKKQEFVQKISFSNYYFEEINFNVFFYFPRRTSIGAICLLQSLPKNQEFVQKLSFSKYYFEEINFNVFFYFPRRTSIGAICLLQSLPKNQRICIKKNFFFKLPLWGNRFSWFFLFSPEGVNRCNLLIAVASQKSILMFLIFPRRPQ